MNIKQNLQESIQDVLKDLGIEGDHIAITHPQNASQGDYSTNVAMILAKKVDKNPRVLAELIVQQLRAKGEELRAIEKIDVAGPGFINFYLSQEYFINELENLLKDNKEPLKTSFNDKKVMVEFTDPNPFKEFHIGHLYSNTVGESIARLLEAAGAEVKRANYQGDVGLHVAKALWGMQRKLSDESKTLLDIAGRSVEERAKWLGEAYALGASTYEEDLPAGRQANAKQEIVELNKKIYAVVGPHDTGDHEISELYHKGRHWSLEYFASIYSRLGTDFAYYYFESEAGPLGLALVKEYLAEGVFTESEGAVVFKGEDHGLHTRVFINSLGLPTYEAKELGLAVKKYEDYSFDLSISITGNEINEYFKVLLKVLSLIKPEIAEKTKHISHGMVRLPEGKMSSRTGNVLTGEWLLDEAKERLKKAYPDMTDETLEMVTVAAIKWALLRSGIGKDISFNIDESISFEGDSGPYVQYTFARTQSVLAKSEGLRAEGTDRPSFREATTSQESLSEEELTLLKLLVRCDEVIVEAAEHYSPNMLTTYLFDVAQAFNHFYQQHSILNPSSVIQEGDSEVGSQSDSIASLQNDTVRSFRLALTEATGNTLKHGLHLLGIQAPEKM